MPLNWFQDPSEYLIDLRPGPGDRFARINDAYAQWELGHGAQFNLTGEYRGRGDDPADFNFAIAMRELSGPKGRVVALGNGTGPAGSDPVREGLFVSRLPVRAHSVAPGVLVGGATAETDDPWDDGLPSGIDPEKVVIIGVMDDAIQVANPRFRDASGRSRVDAAWIQDAPFEGGDGEVAGAGWALHRQFGRVLSRKDITDAIAAHGEDEMALMQALDLIARPGMPYRPSPLRYAASHGTHVADLAAGYPPEDDNRNRRIIAVQLPIYATQDTSGASQLGAAVAGAGFIFDRATRISRKLGVPVPVMLNFSYGLGGGHRTGGQVIERALAAQAEAYRNDIAKALGTAPPVVNLLPAGNGHLSRTHARGAEPASGDASLSTNLRVQPDDRSSSFLEFWVSGGSDAVSVSLETPDGLSHAIAINLPGAATPGQLTRSTGQILAMDDGAGGPDLETVIARVSVDQPSVYPDKDAVSGPWRVLLSLAPTRALLAGQPVAPAGLWSVTCTATGTDAPVRAWVQRDDETMGFGVRGRQSYLQNDAYDATLFDKMTDIAVADQVTSSVTRNGTVSGIATRSDPSQDHQITVGAARWDITGPSIYSAAGFAPENNPQVMIPSDCSRVSPGVMATQNRGGAKGVQSGTSMAAPQVARILGDVAEAMAASAYPTFSAQTILQGMVSAPLRPTPQNPELASTAVVREERCAWGFLEPPKALEKDVIRGSTSKKDNPQAMV